MTGFHLKDITTPKDGLVVMINKYWMCENGDPKKALFYGTSCQCNKDKMIVEMLIQKPMYQQLNKLKIVFVPVAYIPQRD